MRHSAFICPAASVNYDLLQWISLGALWSWPGHLDSHMYLFLNKCIIQWTHGALGGTHILEAEGAIMIGGKMKQGQSTEDMWVGPVLNVTQCARTVWYEDLIGVSCHLGFPRHSNGTPSLRRRPTNSFSPLSSPFCSLNLLQVWHVRLCRWSEHLRGGWEWHLRAAAGSRVPALWLFPFESLFSLIKSYSITLLMIIFSTMYHLKTIRVLEEHVSFFFLLSTI